MIRPQSRRTAFTLIELMISIAMVLVLILGINYVFRTAAEAVDAGQTTNSFNRQAQAAQPPVFDDFNNIVKNPPFFIIASQIVPQYLNADDAQSGGSGPTQIVIDNNTSYTVTNNTANVTPAGSPTLTSANPSNRIHRTDLLRYFAHGLYPRHTAPDGQYSVASSATDALISLGHAALPYTDQPNSFAGPTSDVTNATHRVGDYAGNWVLARNVILLKDVSAINTLNIDGSYYPSDTTSVNLKPFAYGTADNNNSSQIQSSRFDIAGVTLDAIRHQIANKYIFWRFSSYPGNTNLWWAPFIYNVATYPTISQNIKTNQTFQTMSSVPYSFECDNLSFSTPGPVYNLVPTDDQFFYRFEANPLIQAPITASSISQMSPYFLEHCSQFIVEYAGDYMQQDGSGNMTNVGPDGQIDFYLDAAGNKHIRWYGMPRNTTNAKHADGRGGSGTVFIRGYDPTMAENPTTGGLLNYFTDVIPLRDYYSMFWNWTNGNKTADTTQLLYTPPWEVDVNFDPTYDYGNSVADANLMNVAYAQLNGGTASRYVAAWRDDTPAMIRILIKVDDPNNTVKDGPWYEYVFHLK